MKKCMQCNKEIKGWFNKIINEFCSNTCDDIYYFEKLKLENITKENVDDDIKIKYMKLYPFHDGKDLLIKLINEWKNNQDKTLKILNIETYKYSHGQWTAKIIYTFEGDIK